MDALARDFDRLELGARFRSRGPHDHRGRPGLLRRPHRRLPPPPHRRRVGGGERVRRAHRPRHADPLLRRRAGSLRPRVGAGAARLRAGRLQAAGADRRHDPGRGRCWRPSASSTTPPAWSSSAGGSSTRTTPRSSRWRRRAWSGAAPAAAPRRPPATESPRSGGLPVILDGKRILVTGVVNRRSIAFAIAERAQEQGAEVLLTSFGRVRRMTERAAARLPEPARRARARRQRRRGPGGAARGAARALGPGRRRRPRDRLRPRRRARRQLPRRAAGQRHAPPSRPAPTRSRPWPRRWRR